MIELTCYAKTNLEIQYQNHIKSTCYNCKGESLGDGSYVSKCLFTLRLNLSMVRDSTIPWGRKFQISITHGKKDLLYCDDDRDNAEVRAWVFIWRALLVRLACNAGPGRRECMGCSGLFKILNRTHSAATLCLCSIFTSTGARNLADANARLSMLRCVGAADIHTADAYSKKGKIKAWKHFKITSLSR